MSRGRPRRGTPLVSELSPRKVFAPCGHFRVVTRSSSLMNLKTLSLIAATALIGVTGAYAQSTGAASTGTSSNGTSETAARPGPTTARMTQGRGPTSSNGRRMRKHHSMRHGHKHHHRGHHHAHGTMMKKEGAKKAM